MLIFAVFSVHPIAPVLLTKSGSLGTRIRFSSPSSKRKKETRVVTAPLFGRVDSFHPFRVRNFGGNQLLDGSIGLSPLHQVPTIVRGGSDFHQSFLWLHPDRAWIAIFRVPGRSLHQSRPSLTRKKKNDPGVMCPRTCYGALDLTDGRKEETDAPSATAETFVSLPEGKKIPVADAWDANVNDGVWIGGEAAPAGSGTARKRTKRSCLLHPWLRHDTSPGLEPSSTLSRFRYASGVSQWGPYDSRTARTPRSVLLSISYQF